MTTQHATREIETALSALAIAHPDALDTVQTIAHAVAILEEAAHKQR